MPMKFVVELIVVEVVMSYTYEFSSTPIPGYVTWPARVRTYVAINIPSSTLTDCQNGLARELTT